MRTVVGADANVVGLIPEGVDSHTFEPSPATIRTLAGADVLFMDGLHLEGTQGEHLVHPKALHLHEVQGLFKDPVDPARYVENFLVESWAEYLRQRERMTVHDLGARDRVYAFQRGELPPPISRMVFVSKEGRR